jgi:hypothetical protein
MELGNMIFGNSRGRHEVNRSLQDEFCELLEAMGFDSYGNNNSATEWVFENDVFRIQPYYWGDCECGFDELEEQWSKANSHGAECYQTELRGRIEVWEINSGYTAIENRAFGRDGDRFLGAFNTTTESPAPGVHVSVMEPRSDEAMEAYRRASEKRRKGIDKLYDELCTKYGLDRHFGCAVHCTCDHDKNWQKWRSENGHAPTCFVVTPNFLHKPSGFTLDWYKYPLRDSYSSAPLTRKLMRAMFADCAESLASGMETGTAETVKQGSVAKP